MSERSYSPRTVADAFGVSESSLKRWCDRGKLSIAKTAGGHRKIPRSAVLAFARDNRLPFARPELLGLPDLTPPGPATPEEVRDEFLELLVAGREEHCRRLIVRQYLDGMSISRIGDRIVAPAMQTIGHRWACAEVDIYQERFACEICTRLLHELRGMLMPPADDAPLAIGGTPSGDPYALPTQLVELVLREHGWKAISLGCNLPLDSIDQAIRRMRPDLVWLSVSSVEDQADFRDSYRRLFANHGDRLPFVVGGRAMNESMRDSISYSVHCDRLEVLATFLKTFRPSPPLGTRVAAD
ncbi:MAG TPA: DNA-binding protein [Planctomycetaceae bacterium]|nr:DNA-binding protein [Planctomycetaceae bacterium]HRF00695.1 cobalamin-dependent protein [Pirellulaceae bacterium]